MKKKPRRLTQHLITKLTGFDLAIGQAYQEGFYREAEPSLSITEKCISCNAIGLMRWPLHRQINAFGNQITQHRIIYECLTCHNEFMDTTITSETLHTETKKLKLTKFQLTALLTLAREKGFL